MKNNTAHKLSQIPPGYLIMGIDPHKKIHVAVACKGAEYYQSGEGNVSLRQEAYWGHSCYR